MTPPSGSKTLVEQVAVPTVSSNRIANLSLILASLLMSVGVAEVVVRMAGLAPEIAPVERGRFRLSSNPRLGYEPVPGLAYEGRSLAFYFYRGAANSLGFRDREHSETKPEGIRRIAVLGDSIAAGHFIADFEDTFVARLATGLARDSIEVINFAVAG